MESIQSEVREFRVSQRQTFDVEHRVIVEGYEILLPHLFILIPELKHFIQDIMCDCLHSRTEIEHHQLGSPDVGELSHLRVQSEN